MAASPKAASLADLAECLQLLGSRPLKLIADAVQPAFRESFWDDPQWKFSRDADTIADKKLLPFPEDSFQFSLANEQSKQDFHLHSSVLEIYASNFPLELRYTTGAEEKNIGVPSGILIVPPGVAHCVKLHGLTFVFQVAISGKVHNDKVMVESPARP
ncbi:MAG TPA: hypothetical protein VK335_12930 [Bryobacteraceae bacterium]|nr:hypothetical protein [Bryobacteraceae bacterium]